MNTRKSISAFFVFGLTLFLFTSCKPILAGSNGQVFQATTHNISSPTSIIETTDPFQENDNECETINPSRMEKQIDYLGIFPGKTSSQDVKLLLGSPKETGTLIGEIWYYNEFSITFENSITNSIYVEGDGELLVSLEEVIKRYGCPSIIFTVDRGQEPIGDYSILEFIYPEIGIEFLFYGYPINLTDKPVSAEFFLPLSFYDYLIESGKTLYHPIAGKIVSWSEAIISIQP